MNRRKFFQLGALSVTGGSLTPLARPLRAATTEKVSPRGSAECVIFVNMVGGPSQMDTFDLKELKTILNREIVDPFDHRFLNKEVPPFDRTVPTVENIAIEIWNRIFPSLSGPQAKLHSVRVYETPGLYVDYFGESE